ncbi:probable mediator of RNA polymerase II transcription subunit 26c isoform X2 [Mangifera indica]|uniref:probable mediator of RNA polymerase II transcription subunit 26c isoform X2 n=1 Tax=Mangifera indica TaxID=29780 RepID=UPI001CF9D8A9|nr:probable mediator of RNA polymerase II transcription subunit 26c isoform X2 [Mangifera indica]
MDLDEFRSILDSANMDVWTFIDTAILVASLDYTAELKQRRDKIVERLYATCISTRCRNCDFGDRGDSRPNGDDIKIEKEIEHDGLNKGHVSPYTPRSVDDDDNDHDQDDDVDPYCGLFDDEQKRILEIKEHLEDPDQSEDSLIDLLQNLADMDMTFKALKETDIGRDVNRLRKHSSNDVRKLVKHLVRKWKEIVDEWVRLNQPGEIGASAIMDGDSPQQKIPQNGHHQVPDFAYSPNPQNGSSGSDRNNSELERKPKLNLNTNPNLSRKEAAASKPPTAHVPASVQRMREQQQQQKEKNFDSDRLASARKRLQESYKEAENGSLFDFYCLYWVVHVNSPRMLPSNGYTYNQPAIRASVVTILRFVNSGLASVYIKHKQFKRFFSFYNLSSSSSKSRIYKNAEFLGNLLR